MNRSIGETGSPRDKDRRSAELLCPQCETGYLTVRHCKILCEHCGYVESCEDSFVPNRANPREIAPTGG